MKEPATRNPAHDLRLQAHKPVTRNAMNAQLLKRVRREMLRAPDRFCAAHWAFARNSAAVTHRGEAAEGFKCCIAGHVLLLSGRCDERDLLCRSGLHNNDGSLYQRAADALSLTDAQRNELFFPSQWDAPYKQEYYLCSRQEEVAVCAAYIEHFLDKYTSDAAPAPDRPRRRPRHSAAEHRRATTLLP